MSHARHHVVRTCVECALILQVHVTLQVVVHAHLPIKEEPLWASNVHVRDLSSEEKWEGL